MGRYVGLEELRRISREHTYGLVGSVVTPERVLVEGTIIVEGGKISAVLEDSSQAQTYTSTILRLPYVVAPGFVDMHIHGGFGVDAYDVLTSPESLERFRVELAARGTTSVCLTLYTSDISKMARAAKSLASLAKSPGSGSRIVGVHFEGPFINRRRAGAQDPKFIVEPKEDLANSLVDAVLGEEGGEGLSCIVTMAPEVDGALDVARSLSERGVIVSAGHTDADYGVAVEGFRSGFTHVTHLYNAMRQFGHRDPGVIGAALDSSSVTVDLIADSHHVDPHVVRTTVKIKGHQHTAVISDALFPAGLKSFASSSGIHVEGGVAKLGDGTIAGSITLQEGELSVAVKSAAIPLIEALETLSGTPSKIIRRPQLGELRTGAAADFVLLDRDTLGVVGSVLGGHQLFLNPDYAGAELGSHLSSYMYAEILEQPSRLMHTIKAVREASAVIAQEWKHDPPKIVYVVGSGSSYHAAVSARFAFKKFTPLMTAPVPASEFSSWVGNGEAKGGAMIAVSQSGESVDTLRTVQKAKSMGLPVVAVTNNPESTLAKMSDRVLAIGAGAEMAVTATKSFTCSLLSLYTLAVEVGREMGQLAEDDYYNAKLSLSLVPGEVARCISECEWAAYKVSSEVTATRAVFTMGSGVTYPVALEASLKLKEAANIYAEGFALREFLHGPIQLLGSDTAVVVFEPPGGSEGLAEVVEKFRKYGSRVVTVSTSREAAADIVVHTSTQEEFYPIVATVPAQLLALFSSFRRSLNPDSPSKLSKVVR